jgi:hypothetical protein
MRLWKKGLIHDASPERLLAFGGVMLKELEIKQIVDINSGDQNFEVIIAAMHSKTVKIRPLILETITDLN